MVLEFDQFSNTDREIDIVAEARTVGQPSHSVRRPGRSHRTTCEMVTSSRRDEFHDLFAYLDFPPSAFRATSTSSACRLC